MNAKRCPDADQRGSQIIKACFLFLINNKKMQNAKREDSLHMWTLQFSQPAQVHRPQSLNLDGFMFYGTVLRCIAGESQRTSCLWGSGKQKRVGIIFLLKLNQFEDTFMFCWCNPFIPLPLSNNNKTPI